MYRAVASKLSKIFRTGDLLRCSKDYLDLFVSVKVVNLKALPAALSVTLSEELP